MRAVEELQPSIEATVTAYGLARSPRDRGVLYARHLRPIMNEPEGVSAVLRAANTTGTMAGALVVQRALDLLKLHFPVLSRISTNFSSEEARYGQQITTRLVSVPTPGTYHTDNGYVSQAAVASDVSVTIDQHKFVQFEFNANEVAGTRRLLFGEQEEAMHYGLGLGLVEALYALITAANFDSAPTVSSLVDFGRASVIQVGTDMNLAGRNANTGTRTVLLNTPYHGQLSQDISVVSPLYNPASADAIASGILPPVHGFLPVETPNLPAAENLVGFGLRADALAMAVRLPADYSSAIQGLPDTALVQVITNPDTGLSIQSVQYVNHLLGKCYMRLAWMYGVAKGNPAAGQRIVSAL